MEIPSNSYEDIALVYTRFVRQQSEEAAVIIEQIRATFGSRAALRAALIVTIIHEEIQQHHVVPDVSIYTYLLKEYGAAIPLLEAAITCCLESEGMAERDKSGWEKWQRSLEDQRNLVRHPYEDLVQRVRQHSPLTALKLEQIYEVHGLAAGDYGATALIWLQARVDLFDTRILLKLTPQEIREFTYFRYMSKNVEALEHFTEMLECYRLEHQPEQFSLSQVISALLV